MYSSFEWIGDYHKGTTHRQHAIFVSFLLKLTYTSLPYVQY